MTGFIEGVHYVNSEIANAPPDLRVNRWQLRDALNHHVLVAIDDNRDGVIERLEIQSPHELAGQRGYGFMLTGTLTTLDVSDNWNLADAGFAATGLLAEDASESNTHRNVALGSIGLATAAVRETALRRHGTPMWTAAYLLPGLWFHRTYSLADATAHAALGVRGARV